jgi:hypothetical protein
VDLISEIAAVIAVTAVTLKQGDQIIFEYSGKNHNSLYNLLLKNTALIIQILLKLAQ